MAILLKSLRLGSSPFIRNMSSAIMYHQHGDPLEVLEMCPVELSNTLGPTEVKVRMLAAPINPADINMIQGTYALKPALPAVAGNEGVAEVLQVGTEVKNLEAGNWVVPSLAGWGTWRTHAVCPQEQLFKVDSRIGLESASTLTVNPCTAYRLLRDFEKLSPGECVIQNGANSGVGRAVIQLAKKMGLITINVIRHREGLDELKQDLKNLGADYVLVDKELRDPNLSDLWKKHSPRLALNCVGGKSALGLLKCLSPNCSMVTYGGMSKEPVTVGTGLLIFKNVKVLGYWLSNWTEKHEDHPDRHHMYQELTQMYLEGSLKPPKCKLVPFINFKQAVSDFSTQKHLLVMGP